MSASWHVGTILREPLADTLRFVAWYLNAGADGLTLLFDDPQDPAIGVLRDHPKITCIGCTPDFWVDLGLTQDVRFPKRQNVALTWLYGRQPHDWLLNVDADEFMYLPGGDIAAFLAGQPEQVHSVRVETAEIVIAPEGYVGSLYRTPMGRKAAHRVYRDSLEYFGPRRKGLVGHPQGKSFTRAGVEDIRLRQHWPQRARGREVTEVFVPAQSGMALLHHIGLDYDVWRGKLGWRMTSAGFTVPLTHQIEALTQHGDAEDRLRLLHRDLHAMDEARAARLQAEGASLQVQLDLDSIVRAQFADRFGPV